MKYLTTAHLQKLEALKKEQFLLECIEKLDALALPDAFPPERKDYFAFAEHVYDTAQKYELHTQESIYALMLAWHLRGDALWQDEQFLAVMNDQALLWAEKEEYLKKLILDTMPKEEEA